MLSFETISFDYDPYPIGLAQPVFAADTYREMIAGFPPMELLRDTGKHGRKRSLSLKNNKGLYKDYVQKTPVWREFDRYLKSEGFIAGTLAMLHEHQIDLGLGEDNLKVSARLWACLKDIGQGRLPCAPTGLTTRFEFSALPADGGQVIPHTDTMKKIITIVVSILAEDEWDPALGGGTEVMKPKDPRANFNQTNRQLDFDETETLKVFEYRPNQAVVFIKTFNSLHGVRPMTGKGSDLWRRTLTVNIVDSH